MNTARQPSVVIVGAGMTGILLAIKLAEAGVKDLVVLEKSSRVGGTWRENTYPGVACDVPSHMYTYSFEPNPDWSHYFAHGDEIQQYFEKVSKKYDVVKYIHFNEAVTEAHYSNCKWSISTSADKHYTADFFICATGILHHPAFPNIKGLDTFQGDCFHTSLWNHETEFKEGVKVGVIGTGSTAAQFIPELVNAGASVKVFQRTPQWILPLKNFKIPTRVKAWLHRFSWLNNVSRASAKFLMEQIFTKAVTGHLFQRFIVSSWCRINLWLSIKNKDLRDKLRPDYRVGCKRVIVNGTFYRAIQQPNASLITDKIDHINKQGVVTTDGTLHELDVLVLSTGFKPMNFMRPMNLTGKAGLHIDEAWKNEIKTYRSLLVPEFPNLFLMLGPNTPIGNFSVIAMSEVQTAYILKLIERWQNHEFDSVEPKHSSVQEFNAYIKRGLRGTAWVGGCNSWYLDSNGEPILWPYTWGQWVKEMKTPNMDDLYTE